MKKKLGFWTSSSLVVGNMIGSGIYLLPATLTGFGSISLFGWLVSAVGAMALAFVFIELSRIFPATSGGPYTFSRKGLGDFAGFLVAWGYWISVWSSNAAITVAFVSYLSVFVPVLATSPLLSTVVGVSTIWIISWINTRGIREAGLFQLITSILKVIPLLAYLATSAAFAVAMVREKGWNQSLLWKLIIAGIAFIFSIWAIAGSGMEIVYWGFILLMCGIPVYVWVLIRRVKEGQESS